MSGEIACTHVLEVILDLRGSNQSDQTPQPSEACSKGNRDANAQFELRGGWNSRLTRKEMFLGVVDGNFDWARLLGCAPRAHRGTAGKSDTAKAGNKHVCGPSRAAPSSPLGRPVVVSSPVNARLLEDMILRKLSWYLRWLVNTRCWWRPATTTYVTWVGSSAPNCWSMQERPMMLSLLPVSTSAPSPLRQGLLAGMRLGERPTDMASPAPAVDFVPHCSCLGAAG